jgi:hypothetical protein
MLLARGIAECAPERHRPLTGPIDPGVRIQTRFDGQGPGSFLIGIGSHLILLCSLVAIPMQHRRTGTHDTHRKDTCRLN